jgi:glyoxylase-like metal-dependent hydrolase (beta-lactamase superfamily II)
MRFLVLLLCFACLPNIPQRTLTQRTTLPSGLPELSPCALVHLELDEDLSNGARGWFRGDWKLSYTSFLIRHPKGVLLIDASFGDSANADLDAAPWWFRWQFKSARAARPLATLLAEAGVKPEEVTLVLLTHAHWDHTGGLAQLPNARIALSTAEADWILGKDLPAFAMPQHFDKVRDRLQRVQFDAKAYDGFAASHDLFGDGSIVAVPSPGHTRGATSWFVNSGGGKRWLFIGDTAWVKEGFEEPVTKGRMASYFADSDLEQTAESLASIHAVYAANAATVVTSHDERTWTGVPRCAVTSTSPGARPSSASP